LIIGTSNTPGRITAAEHKEKMSLRVRFATMTQEAWRRWETFILIKNTVRE